MMKPVPNCGTGTTSLDHVFCQKICQVLLNKVTDMNNNMIFLSFVCCSLRTMYLYRIPTMCKRKQRHFRGKLGP